MGVSLKFAAALAVSPLFALVAGCSSSKHGASPPTYTQTPTPTQTFPASVPVALSDSIKARLHARVSSLVTAENDPLIQTADEVRGASNGEEHSVDRGLDAAGTQRLTSKGGNSGVSVVFHFPSAEAALADYKASTSHMGGSTTEYQVPGIPNSAGADGLLDGKAKDRNVTFLIGSYEYRLGFSLDAGDTPTRAEFIAMTQAWYDKAKTLP